MRLESPGSAFAGRASRAICRRVRSVTLGHSPQPPLRIKRLRSQTITKGDPVTTKTETTAAVTTRATRSVLFNVLIGLTALAVLLQAVWAGIFLEHDGERDAASSWIDVHARGGEIAIVLALLATIVALVKLRHRRDLWIGSAALTVLLIVESYVGGLIRDDSKDTLTAVHVPLAMAIMALVIWLPLRARTRHSVS